MTEYNTIFLAQSNTFWTSTVTKCKRQT